MKKIGLLLLMGAAIVAISTGGAWADRVLQGTYTYGYVPNSDSWPWYTPDAFYAPNNYDGTTAMSDANKAGPGYVNLKLRPTRQTYAQNPAQLTFTDPSTLGTAPAFQPDPPVSAPGASAVWWGQTPGNDRFNAVLLDLGAQVQISAIATVHNLAYANSMSLQQYEVQGSNDGSTWTRLIWEEAVQKWQTPRGPAEVWSHVFARPATVPIGKFYNPANGLYDLNTVTYQYLKFNISRSGEAEGEPALWDSTALSEIVILNTTLSGDTNLDGDVDLTDLGALAGNYGATSGKTWAQGDFNGDGDVDLGDLGALAGNYGIGVPIAPGAPLNFAFDAASVGLPEPATMMLLGLGAFGVIRRRR